MSEGRQSKKLDTWIAKASTVSCVLNPCMVTKRDLQTLQRYQFLYWSLF